MISLDTLRADHVGGANSITPQIDRFASDSVTVRTALSPIPFTLPSHMTMFTGLYPDQHQVTHENARLSNAIPTLAEELSDRGYSTFGVFSNTWLDGDFGFARGFDQYFPVGGKIPYSQKIYARVIQLLLKEASVSSSPTFIFVHNYDVHSDDEGMRGNRMPYFAPEEFRLRQSASSSEPSEQSV